MGVSGRLGARAASVGLAVLLGVPLLSGVRPGDAQAPPSSTTTTTLCTATTWTFVTYTTTSTTTSTVTIPSGCLVDGDCDDGSACTHERCDAETGKCVVELLQCFSDFCNLRACDPALGCVPAPPPDCDDGNACTEDFCNPNRGCLNRPFNVAECLPPEVLDCDDGDPCTVDGCEPATGCVSVPRDCDDGDSCTLDACGPAGCTHTNPCDDGDPCTLDVCDNPCTHVNVCLDCATGPRTDCVGAARGSLLIRELVTGRERLTLRLAGFAEAVVRDDFGDPVAGSTGYALCLYDGAEQAVAGLRVERAGDSCGDPALPCWRALGAERYEYRDIEAAADGVAKIAAKEGAAGYGRLGLRGANNAAKGLVALPIGLTAALEGEATVVAQMRTTDARCFGGRMTVRRSSSQLLKAAGPMVPVSATSTSTTLP